MLTLEDQLRRNLVDDFSQHVLTGAIRVAKDSENPIRLNLFSAAIRELFAHTLHTLAPDSNVKSCSWFAPEPNTKGPTRRQRAKYATQGGLSDEFIAEAGVDVAHLHDDAIRAIDELSKYTHVRPGVLIDDQQEINRFVEDALTALLGLFDSFDECRGTVVQALYDHIDEAIVDEFIRETLESIDELASHHTIEEVAVEDMAITSLTDSAVEFKVRGSLGVELQWGSGGDLRRGEGATMRQSFPFEVTMRSPVGKVTAFEDVAHTVDTRGWYE